MLDVHRGHLLVYLPFKCASSSLMLPWNKKLNIDIYTLNIKGQVIIPKSSVGSAHFHPIPKFKNEWSPAPSPYTSLPLVHRQLYFFIFSVRLPQVFVDCHVRAVHNRWLKERGGVWSSHFNECPSLDERFIGVGGHTNGRDDNHKGLSRSCVTDFVLQFCARREK